MKIAELTLDRAIEGYLLHIESGRYSQATIKLRTYILSRFAAHVGSNTQVTALTVTTIQHFLIANPKLSAATILSYHAALSSFFNWAIDAGLVTESPLTHIKPPKPESRIIEPFTKDEIKAMLRACDRTRDYKRGYQRTCSNARPTALRDRAIILLLLDTGLRASELSGIKISDLDLKHRRVIVFGKGAKERLLPFDSRTGQAIWKYLATREDARAGDYLFITSHRLPFDKDKLGRLIHRIGARANVKNAHPHRFRHTFAITFLRNSGDVFTLQRLLGHSTLKMVNHYLALAQTDVEAAHRRASPVANWNL